MLSPDGPTGGRLEVQGRAVRDVALRADLVQYAAKWLLVGTVIIPFAGLWYITSLPQMAREISMGAAPVLAFTLNHVIFSA